jgi:chromosomal replication initiator protein
MTTKTSTECVELWDKCLEVIRDNVNTQSFNTWFEPIVPRKLEGSVLTIEVPSQFYYEWIEEHYVALLKSTLRYLLGPDARLEYSIIIHNDQQGGQNYAINLPTASLDNERKNPPVNYPLNSEKPVPNHWVIAGLKKISIDPQLNPHYTFATFVEGTTTRVAYNAALDVVHRLGTTTTNPFYIYGACGLGKTHLCQAIGNEIRRCYPNKVVLYTQIEKFINQYHDAVRAGNLSDFLSFYQLIDVLIVDDIQFLASKNKTQEQFLHVFNHLYLNSKQLILTADAHPESLKGFEKALTNRFTGGIVIEMPVPEYENRVKILEKKMYTEGISIPDEVTQFVASRITTNVRDLEGAMISLIAQSSFNHKEIDMELASNIVGNFVKNTTREISVEEIMSITAEYFKITVDLLRAATRKRGVVEARQIAMFFCRKYTKASLKTIGQHFGGRDHSTVIHAENTIKDLSSYNRSIKNYVEEVEKRITNWLSNKTTDNN